MSDSVLEVSHIVIFEQYVNTIFDLNKLSSQKNLLDLGNLIIENMDKNAPKNDECEFRTKNYDLTIIEEYQPDKKTKVNAFTSIEKFLFELANLFMRNSSQCEVIVRIQSATSLNSLDSSTRSGPFSSNDDTNTQNVAHLRNQIETEYDENFKLSKNHAENAVIANRFIKKLTMQILKTPDSTVEVTFRVLKDNEPASRTDLTVSRPQSQSYSETEYQSSRKIPKYDLDGDRDLICFNITEYQDSISNRIGSEIDGELIKETLLRKQFKLKAFRDGKLHKNTIINDLRAYAYDVEVNKRDIKILIITFMAHGAEGDRIIFSDETTLKYTSLLQPIFNCERRGSTSSENDCVLRDERIKT